MPERMGVDERIAQWQLVEPVVLASQCAVLVMRFGTHSSSCRKHACIHAPPINIQHHIHFQVPF